MNLGLAKKWFKWSQVVLAMLLVQVFSTGMQVLSRVALVKGTFVFALMTYRNVVAALCVAPLAYYFERFYYEFSLLIMASILIFLVFIYLYVCVLQRSRNEVW